MCSVYIITISYSATIWGKLNVLCCNIAFTFSNKKKCSRRAIKNICIYSIYMYIYISVLYIRHTEKHIFFLPYRVIAIYRYNIIIYLCRRVFCRAYISFSFVFDYLYYIQHCDFISDFTDIIWYYCAHFNFLILSGFSY